MWEESPRAVYSTSSLNLLRTFQLQQREQRGEEEKNVRWRDHAAEVCYSSYPGKYTIQSFCARPSVWQREWETLCESRALVSLHHSMSLVSAYCVLVFIPSLLLVSPVQLFTPVFPLSALPLASVSLSIGCLLPQVFPPSCMCVPLQHYCGVRKCKSCNAASVLVFSPSHFPVSVFVRLSATLILVRGALFFSVTSSPIPMI